MMTPLLAKIDRQWEVAFNTEGADTRRLAAAFRRGRRVARQHHGARAWPRPRRPHLPRKIHRALDRAALARFLRGGL